MRFLANENFPGDAVMALEANGHDIVWIRTAAPGSTDQEILAWAVRESRVLLKQSTHLGTEQRARPIKPYSPHSDRRAHALSLGAVVALWHYGKVIRQYRAR